MAVMQLCGFIFNDCLGYHLVTLYCEILSASSDDVGYYTLTFNGKYFTDCQGGTGFASFVKAFNIASFGVAFAGKTPFTVMQ